MATLKALQKLVDKKIEMLQKKAVKAFGKRVPNMELRYNLKGVATAGQAVTHRYSNDLFRMELHPAALMEYQEEYIEGTVVHEFAHLVQKQHHPMSKPHGKEWKEVMVAFGKDPKRCHSMNLRNALEKFAKITGKPAPKQRRMGRHAYVCNCDTHQLSTVRHNKVRSGKASYSCKNCGATLKLKK